MLTVHDEPISDRPFHGLGFQADAYVYDEVNRKAGVTEADLEMVEGRIRAIRPSLVRTFGLLQWFNESLDGRTFDWDRPRFRSFVRLLGCCQDAGAKVNLCHGRGWGMSWDEGEFALLAGSLSALLGRLRDEEGIGNIAWVTLFNEPEVHFAHDSEVYRQALKRKPKAGRSTWEVYVRIHREVGQLLGRLDPSIRLIVADTVYGPAMRRERLELARRDLGDLRVGYSFHNYNPEDAAFYDGLDAVWQYDGMAADCESLRRIVGADAELILWEFNNAGRGFGGLFPGVGPHGEELLGSCENAVVVCDKVFSALNHGIDAACLWCLCDAVYFHNIRRGVMSFGLWRYRWQDWIPRPYYYYYAALCHAFRPRMRPLRTTGADERANVLAAADGEHTAAAVINKSGRQLRTQLALPGGGAASVLRVHPGRIPTDDEMPLTEAEPLQRRGGMFELRLKPAELAVVRSARQ